jgi:hypothetical protein
MPSVAGSIPPLAPSRPPPAVVLRPERRAPGAHPRGAAAVRKRSSAPGAATPLLSLVPPPPAVPIEHARPLAPRVASAPAAPLTAIAFRPDGRPAMTLQLGALHCVAALVLASGVVGTALLLGWLFGEWTARL